MDAKVVQTSRERMSESELDQGRIIKVRPVYRFVKRFFDVVLSALALVVLSPVFLGTALAIYLEDRGPVVYSQTRIGKDFKTFEIYKFRSMVKNADQIHETMKQKSAGIEVSFKLKNDPRVTKVGYWIRKFNIDELPQLLNILRGDMSIVGPRPLPDYEFWEEQERYGNQYIERFSVPQGLTCYWQLSDRAERTFEERMQMDVKYARDCSLGKDFWMIVKTALYTVTGKAEY